MPGRYEFDPLWQRTLSQGKVAPQMQPLAIFLPSLLEQSRERLAPGLGYLQCFTRRNGAPNVLGPIASHLYQLTSLLGEEPGVGEKGRSFHSWGV